MKKISYELYKRVRREAEKGIHSAVIAKSTGLKEIQILEILTTTFSNLNSQSEIDIALQRKLEQDAISPRDRRIIELRKDGKTLDEIGIMTKLTRERVRQILKKHKIELDIDEIRSKQKIKEFEQMQKENDGIFHSIKMDWTRYKNLRFQDLADIFNVPEWRLRQCLSKVQYVYLKANEESNNAQFWTDEQCLASLKLASTYAFPLTVLKYRKLLEIGEISGPTPAIYWQRFGSWVKACEKAGVEYGEAVREYNRTWNDSELIRYVRRFMFSRTDGKWSLEKYEEWRRLPEIEGPSMALLRLRFGSWSEIRVLALELHAPEFDMKKFYDLRFHEK